MAQMALAEYRAAGLRSRQLSAQVASCGTLSLLLLRLDSLGHELLELLHRHVFEVASFFTVASALHEPRKDFFISVEFTLLVGNIVRVT